MTRNLKPENHQDMPLIGHLVELRGRLIRILVVLLVIFLSLLYFANDLYAGLSAPLRALLPEGSTMIATDVTSPLLAPFKLTFYVAVFIAIPYILYQFWGFIAPALYQHERRIAIPLVASSIFLFYLGVAFAYFVTLPAVLGFFTTIGPTEVAIMTDINLYLSFALKLFVVFGITFEIPIAIIILVAAGLTTPESLAEKRRYIIVGFFSLAMFFTPPDVLSMVMLGVPMILLFETGLFVSRFFYKQPAADTE